LIGFIKRSIQLLLISAVLSTLGHSSPPALDLTSAFGVNIHGGGLLYPRDLHRIRNAGFTWVRVGLPMRQAEGDDGAYDFSFFDVLAAQLKSEGLRALVILYYGNPYDAGRRGFPSFLGKSDSDEFREAYAKFSADAVARYAGRGFIWEQWNEPNNKHAWPPEPNSASYIALVRRACLAIREKSPNEIIIGPASSYVDLKFVEACLQGGMLEFWSGISVHPYRQNEPEAAAGEYTRLRTLIARYATPGQPVPIICGEWGYSTAWKGYDDFKQADFLKRMFELNRREQIPLTIWYDWRDDGVDPANQEHRFGLVRQAPGGLFEPKPAFFSARRELIGQ
jgi:hypothetical protein